MAKIQMKNAIAELDGDEMTRVLWAVIKEKLLEPFVELKTEYYDLGLKNRDDTDDKVTYDSAAAIKRLKVGVKCATITSNAARMKEYNLKQLTRSPNGIIREELDGTVFRAPIFVKNIACSVTSWKKPIVLGRHAYGDVYKNCELKTDQPGKAELVFTGADGKEIRKTIQEMKGPGIIQGIHNLDSSIESFARCCFSYALDQKISVWLGTKDTISKTYDGNFKAIFQRVFDEEFKAKFDAAGIEYFYTLIDDAVARVMKSEGGFLWACKNYDGDVMSDMIASACGSLAMMTSILVSPNGEFEYEASHGTVQKHFYRYQAGEKTSTNPVALIFAWTGALAKRAELDGTPELAAFAKKLEKATLDTIESGVMTGDLARIAEPKASKVLNSWEFIDEIAKKL
ncbi:MULTISPECIES: NADP-dependent isocitrate dehydrogenase [Treponema]|jgi:isocitrate dehydrogenase|uniref:Isocitrate dehydrogenase [NADP] n=1 Tax=Treponema saccharophilum DSM 2985 TaxID=907348 RepID=H7ELM0_9SPIR|nr:MULTISPECIES: NADP-dependent isocitrate dehydrogenase [Treponema]EIC01561.1 isocitrate dehydrogenase, NADP-dependent [Treponema saccharophilum DSM 2985]MBQ5537175.1 NADP-dependent isocitrate dehydrogenase [Treponema sp.]BDC95533.1 isocitrate dehydrogenase [Treponema saccharophilum]